MMCSKIILKLVFFSGIFQQMYGCYGDEREKVHGKLLKAKDIS